LLSMQRELGFAALYVTHDQTEAMELAHTIAVLEKGKVAQEGTPKEIYREPGSRYVGGFVGTLNEIPGVVRELNSDGGATVETPVGVLTAGSVIDGIAVGDRVVVVCRPERAELGATPPSLANRWEATIEASVFSGSRTEHVVAFEGIQASVWRSDWDLFSAGAAVWVGVATEDLRALPIA
jgi:iron(III) transport system ATP-binding protein